MDRTVAEYGRWTRAVVARLSSAEEPQPDQVPEENDDVDTWMADPRGGPPSTPPSPHADVVDRIDRGELSWRDPEATAVRSFLAERVAEYRRARP